MVGRQFNTEVLPLNSSKIRKVEIGLIGPQSRPLHHQSQSLLELHSVHSDKQDTAPGPQASRRACAKRFCFLGRQSDVFRGLCYKTGQSTTRAEPTQMKALAPRLQAALAFKMLMVSRLFEPSIVVMM